MAGKRQLKKELAKPDFFQTTIAAIQKSFHDHQREVAIAFGLFILIGLAVWGFSFYNDSQNAKAISALDKVMPDYQSYLAEGEIDSKALIGDLTVVIDNHSGTPAAGLAAYQVGEVYYRQGDFKRAIEFYERYLNTLPKGQALRAVVYNNIGYSHEELGEFEKASQAYLQAAQTTDNPIKDRAFLNAARVLEKSGKLKEASEYYDKVVNDFPDSTLSDFAKTKLAALKTEKS